MRGGWPSQPSTLQGVQFPQLNRPRSRPVCYRQPLLQWHQIGKPNYSQRESIAIPFSKPDFLSSKPYLVLVGTQNKSELWVSACLNPNSL